MSASLPRRLYKYRPVDVFTSDIFVRGLLFLPFPEELNDEFDCDPVISDRCTEPEFREHLCFHICLNNPNLSDSEVQRRSDATAYPPSAAVLRRVKKDYFDRIARCGVLSASQRSDCVPMWAHYAAAYEGICIEIDPRALCSSSGPQFHKVKYRRTRRRLNFFTDTERLPRLSVIYKNKDWEYEEEWRMVVEAPSGSESGSGYYLRMEPGTITAVLLGPSMTEPEDRERMIEWSHRLKPAPRVYSTRLSDSSYRVCRDERLA